MLKENTITLINNWRVVTRMLRGGYSVTSALVESQVVETRFAMTPASSMVPSTEVRVEPMQKQSYSSD